MGTMHRADVIRILDEKGLKLVLLSEHKDPPLYQLMTGKQIHEEQLKLREKQKSKAGRWSVSEVPGCWRRALMLTFLPLQPLCR